MTRHYSPAAGGFFDDALHSERPADAIALTDREYLDLLAAQEDGMTIALVDGKVSAVPAPPATLSEQMAAVRVRRDRLLAATDPIVSVPDYPISPARREQLLLWRSALRDVPASADPVAALSALIETDRPAWLSPAGAITATKDD